MNQTTYPAITQRAIDALTQGAAVVDRGSGDVLRLSDADRHDFLHRMTTNNINALRPGQSAVTVLTSPTARVLFVFTVLARPDDLLLLTAPGQGPALARHLRGQIFFMDKVKLEDVGSAWARLRVTGPQAATAVAALGIDAAGLAANAWAAAGEVAAIHQPDYDLPGYEVIVPAADHATVLTALQNADAVMIDAATAEARRIELGRPAAGAELTEDVNPLEAGLAWTCADNKGCYTGQEIIARQITYDKVTKTLVGLRSEHLLTPGSDISVEGRSVGVVTSATISPTRGVPVALAIVKRPHNQPGVSVQVDGQNAEVVALSPA